MASNKQINFPEWGFDDICKVLTTINAILPQCVHIFVFGLTNLQCWWCISSFRWILLLVDAANQHNNAIWFCYSACCRDIQRHSYSCNYLCVLFYYGGKWCTTHLLFLMLLLLLLRWTGSTATCPQSPHITYHQIFAALFFLLKYILCTNAWCTWSTVYAWCITVYIKYSK